VSGQDGAASVLVVDDDEVFRTRLGRALSSRGYEVRLAADGLQALRLAQVDSPELCVLDLRMPDTSGLEVLRELLAVDPTTRVIMLTGYGSIATAVEAMRLGAAGYVQKPAGADEILAAFDKAAAAPLTAVQEYASPSLARVEWEHIQRVLGDCGGNLSRAARQLGMHRRSLQRKLQKYPPKR